MFDDVLSESPLFRGISGGEVLDILEAVPYQIKVYPEGYLIAQSGEKVQSLIVMLRGKVSGEMVNFSGKILKIEDIEAPHLLATAFLFGGGNCFPVNVVSCSEVELLVIRREDFVQLMLRNKQILLNYLHVVSSRSQFLSEKLRFLSFKTLKGKMAHYLLQKTGGRREETELDRSQRELAELFNVARPSLGRAIGEMEQEGILLVERRKVKILDRNRLADLLQ